MNDTPSHTLIKNDYTNLKSSNSLYSFSEQETLMYSPVYRFILKSSFMLLLHERNNSKNRKGLAL